MIQQVPPLKGTLFVLTKKEDKELIDARCARDRFDSYSDFDKFVATCFKIKTINSNVSKWDECACSCVYYAKHYSCYHIIAIAVAKKLTSIPDKFKNVPIGQKPKRGRKPKAKPALVRQ